MGSVSCLTKGDIFFWQNILKNRSKYRGDISEQSVVCTVLISAIIIEIFRKNIPISYKIQYKKLASPLIPVCLKKSHMNAQIVNWLQVWTYQFVILTKAYISLPFPLSPTLTATTTKHINAQTFHILSHHSENTHNARISLLLNRPAQILPYQAKLDTNFHFTKYIGLIQWERERERERERENNFKFESQNDNVFLNMILQLEKLNNQYQKQRVLFFYFSLAFDL